MDGIDLLRAQALQNRNAAIAVARREYAAALKEIKALNQKLREPCLAGFSGSAGWFARRQLGRLRWLAFAGSALLAMPFAIEPAFAHHVVGGKMPVTFMDGLLSGLGHPIIGLDHLAAIPHPEIKNSIIANNTGGSCRCVQSCSIMRMW